MGIHDTRVGPCIACKCCLFLLLCIALCPWLIICYVSKVYVLYRIDFEFIWNWIFFSFRPINSMCLLMLVLEQFWYLKLIFRSWDEEESIHHVSIWLVLLRYKDCGFWVSFKKKKIVAYENQHRAWRCEGVFSETVCICTPWFLYRPTYTYELDS